MPYKHLNLLSTSPYNDDFDANKNFLQVLFRPGYAVQARELTQLQTILQNQISKVGDHLFLDGTHVYGAKISSSNYYFARIDDILLQSGGSAGTITANTFKNKCFCPTQIKFKNAETVYNTRNSASSNDIDALEKDMQIEIVDVLDKTTSDDWIVIFKINKGSFQILDQDLSDSVDYATPLVFSEITTGPSGGNVNTLKTFSNIQNTNAAPIKFSFKQRLTSSSTVLVENTNQVLCVGISAGIFYKDGRFIQTPNTFIPLYKLSEKISSNQVEIESTMYDSSSTFAHNPTLENRRLFSYPSKKVGFQITYDDITELEDATLLDNANGFTNLNAPGAARLKAIVTAVSEKFDPNDPESYKSKTIAGNDFIELVRYKKGVIQSIKEETEYNEILKLFAGRTYDESGSYTVNPFKLEIKEHLKRDVYRITFNTDLETSVEVGDMVFKKVLTTGGTVASTRLLSLIFPSATIGVGQNYPTEFSEPIGVVKQLVNANTIDVEMLNSYSFTGLAPNTVISRKANDLGTISDLTGVVQKVVFIPDTQGLYTLGDLPTGDEDKAAILVNPGKGYIEGFKVENYNSSIVELPKGRSSNHQISDTSSIDFTNLENVLYMKLSPEFNTASATSQITDTYINIEADTSLVAMYFAGPTVNDYADAAVLSWSPFEQGNLVNSNTSNSILPLLNKESVLFVTSEKAPILPED